MTTLLTPEPPDPPNPLDPIAEAMFRGRAFAETVGELHRDIYDHLPITAMARAHAMRSAIQSEVILGRVPGFDLIDKYLWTGRLEVTRVETRRNYLLKARNALPFEVSFQGSLFEEITVPDGVGPLLLLLYEFRAERLVLATVPTEKVRTRAGPRFRLLGDVVEQGAWSVRDIPGLEPFDQGTEDDFGDLSEDIRIEGEEDAE